MGAYWTISSNELSIGCRHEPFASRLVIFATQTGAQGAPALAKHASHRRNRTDLRSHSNIQLERYTHRHSEAAVAIFEIVSSSVTRANSRFSRLISATCTATSDLTRGGKQIASQFRLFAPTWALPFRPARRLPLYASTGKTPDTFICLRINVVVVERTTPSRKMLCIMNCSSASGSVAATFMM